MNVNIIFEKFQVSFLPAFFQEKYLKEKSLKAKHLSFYSIFFNILLSIFFWFSFYGFYQKFKPGIFWIVLFSLLFFTIFFDGFIRILFLIFKKKIGSFPFSLVYKYLLKLKKSEDFYDDIIETPNSLIIHSPCPKPHWVQWGGVSYKNKSFKIVKHLKLEVSHFFKFEISEEKFPEIDLEKEKNYNILSDFSIILSPFWGFLPEKYQFSLLKYQRYNLKFNFYFSLILTFFVSFPSLIFDLIRIMQKGDVLYFILPHFLISLFFVYESLFRFLIYITERKIKGSLLAFIIKPLYYMIYEEFL